MSGFAKVIINKDEVDNLLKKYKKIKKYMSSSYYDIKKMDKTESIVTNLIQEDPPTE
jgi:hypothetical protein